jgi:hypothetical protein
MGAFHFARLKLRKQAAMLVKRYNKFSKLLPEAEAKLAEQLQLMVHTPADERPALVRIWREALREHAQGDSTASGIHVGSPAHGGGRNLGKCMEYSLCTT